MNSNSNSTSSNSLGEPILGLGCAASNEELVHCTLAYPQEDGNTPKSVEGWGILRYLQCKKRHAGGFDVWATLIILPHTPQDEGAKFQQALDLRALLAKGQAVPDGVGTYGVEIELSHVDRHYRADRPDQWVIPTKEAESFWEPEDNAIASTIDNSTPTPDTGHRWMLADEDGNFLAHLEYGQRVVRVAASDERGTGNTRADFIRRLKYTGGLRSGEEIIEDRPAFPTLFGWKSSKEPKPDLFMVVAEDGCGLCKMTLTSRIVTMTYAPDQPMTPYHMKMLTDLEMTDLECYGGYRVASDRRLMDVLGTAP